ncbi:hypothetical protein DN752_18805 [Echinicola strongylocentroti]|uniref:histidine kinase n=1 Tax=Echinicola strongylocentroti TaxID=1795355 RepID=A0A2Z4IMS0_9BACT|nr:ATP-binding protein [Echinicola strongylocentroti]AWW32019.1 hypothetical protein DN752_18805 [Echinicola strongylocentroti]
MLRHLGRSEIILNFIFISTVVLLVVIAGSSFIQHQLLLKSQNDIIQSHHFNYSLQNLIVEVSDMESAERAYVASGDKRFLNNYGAIKDSVYNTIREIRQLAISANVPPATVDSLQFIVQGKLDHLEKVIALYGDGKTFVQLQDEFVEGDSLMRNIKTATSMMGYVTYMLFQDRKQYLEKKNKDSPYFTVITFLFSLALFTTAYFKIGNDLRKQKRTLNQLEINHEIFEKAEAMAETGHWKFDPEEREITLSNNQYRLLGYEPKEISPDFWFFIRHVDKKDRKQVVNVIRKVESGLSAESIDVRIFTASGQEKCLQMVIKMHVDEFGKKTVIGVNRDLTKIIASKQELQELNKKLTVQNNAYNNAETIGQMGSISMDCNTGQLSASDNMFGLLGMSSAGDLSDISKFKACIHPEDQADLEGYFTCNSSATDHDWVSFRLMRDSGEYIYVSSLKKIVEESWGKILTTVVRDITAEREAELKLKEQNAELKKINEQLSSFNHIASHDLQEPLRKIQTFISRINEDIDQVPEDLVYYFVKIQKSAERMQQLILDLLDFSRVSRIEDEFKTVALNELVSKSINEMAVAIEEKKGKVHCEKLSTIKVIPFQIIQLFTNLISNSLKYSAPDRPPEIHVSASPVNEEERAAIGRSKPEKLVKIIFEDNGIGFEQEFATTIFELFQRLHPKTSYSGTGIGLAICKKIVQIHRGEIFANSAPGKGTKFTIILPEN